MKKLNLSLLVFSSMLIFSCSNADKSHEAPATHDTVAAAAPEVKNEMPEMDSAACAQAMEQNMKPGEMHKWLASQDGKWNAEMTFWMSADGQPMPGGSSVIENKMILGGRYQQSTYKGKMMGMDFEGHGTYAYDNAKKKFISTWIDNTGTGVICMEGTYDEASKTLNLAGKMTDPATGHEGNMRETVKIIDDKNQVLEMYQTGKDGKEFKGMEIKMVRK